MVASDEKADVELPDEANTTKILQFTTDDTVSPEKLALLGKYNASLLLEYSILSSTQSSAK